MTPRRSTFTSLLLIGSLGIGPLGLAAESGDMDKLVKEIGALLDKGEKERLVDPWLLRDLREVLRQFDFPWREKVLSDDFSSREPRPAPPWQVTAGEFLVDWRYGLRSVVESAPAAAPAAPAQPAQERKGDKAKALIGAILQQALGEGQGQQAGEAKPAPARPGNAAVIAQVPIPNAFAVQMQLTARALAGGGPTHFEFGPYQKSSETGYRLLYSGNTTPSLSLLALSASGGISTVELYNQPLNLVDGEVHNLEWTRDKAGAMNISVDGKPLIRVADRRFRDAFDGLAIVNRGGDFALRQITINGAK